MDDVVLVTADSVRHDHRDAMEFVSSLDAHTGITAAHYTRPSLAGLLTANLLSALQSKAVGPTLPEVLAEHGYTCIGLVPSPQADSTFGFDAGFDAYETFSEGGGNPLENRRSQVREFLGGFPLVRRLYRRLVPMEAVLTSLPDDGAIVDEAIERFNDAPAPRFLWVHLMGSHRPYGTGAEALPPALDRKAGAAGNRGLLRSKPVSDRETELIRRTYRRALARVDSRIERLLDGLDSDPAVAFTSDHGDELGEEGYFYHQGFRRRVVDTLTEVPVAFSGLSVERDRFSLLDVAPTLLGHVGIEPPERWHGSDLAAGGSEPMVTIAPWHEAATVAVRTDGTKLVASDADVSLETGGERAAASRTEVPAALEDRLRDLGYADAG
ncbi:sulfatase [Halobacteriales archaeon QS_4_69_34]|nr:MAG: sulfatase [Halobacteriales archaeon QS_4_69_34]